jgi:signal transduction histidine kinase
MAAFGIVTASRAVTAEAEGRVEATASLEGSAIAAQLEGLRALARSLAREPTVVAAAVSGVPPSNDTVQAALDQTIDGEEGVVSIAIADEDGILLALSPRTPEAIGQDFSFRDWYRGAEAAGAAYVSGAMESAAAGHPLVVAAATPIHSRPGGPAVGYVSLGYGLAAVQAFVADFESSQHLQLVITDQTGVVLAAPDPPVGLQPIGEDEAVQSALHGEAGVRTQDGAAGEEIVGYAPVAASGWTVTARVARSVALQRVETLRTAGVAVSLTIAAALTVVLVILARIWRSRSEAELALERTVTELNRSNEELEQFAYAASHDLSEPLRAISGPISLVARRYRGQLDAESDEFIEFAVDGCTRMQQLIDGLLAYSRVGRLETAFGSVDCRLVMNGVLKALGPAISESGATVEVGDLPTVTAEANQLGQVFSNLLSNAIKFARPGVPPSVQVRADRAGPAWRFTVTDNGIGIASEHRERVFGMFKRLHSREDYPGTGIGLALVRKVVERHGGRVGVEDPPAGIGCRLWFTLPADKERS